MAKTQAGRELTDTHRRDQVILRATIEQAATALDGLMDLDNLTGSFPRWFVGRSVLANAGVDTSARLAGAYVAEYGLAEAGVELVAGAPEFDQQRIAREAYTDTVVMTKARIAAGMSPEEAWRIQSAITYGKLGQLVLDAGRQTITTSSFKYSGRRGRWRRVSDGAPCAFCAMLVGRGPVYQEQSVQFRAHNHCGCTAELVLHEWEPTEEEALYRASYMQAALDAEEEFGRSWARTAAGENQILARMRRNNPGLFNDGVFAKDSQFRSPAWVKAKESTRCRREKIKLATGLGGGGAKPPKLPNGNSESSDGYSNLARALDLAPDAKLIHEPMREGTNSFRAPTAASIPAKRIAPATDPWRYFEKDTRTVAEHFARHVDIGLYSIQEASGPGADKIKSPDAIFETFAETIEFKLQKSAKLDNFKTSLGRSRSQSENLAFLTNAEVSDDRLETLLREYVSRYGHGHRVVIGMSQSGKVVYWVNDRR
ncbi:VG15 protein [Trueperella abortisuis]|uniref:tRNA nuclease CdiA C-terminal domain-containing protein n=1 Tax=Trueperella abortisuis TaxID=445930 RepID=A0ABT9PJV8_9ACTO|nr:hypothetical protein [Trueperella abortisuis]MDP9833005.1 hypothetical protein [Trueperella abortisuis]